MKKITEESVKNFLARKPYKNANMLISMEVAYATCVYLETK